MVELLDENFFGGGVEDRIDVDHLIKGRGIVSGDCISNRLERVGGELLHLIVADEQPDADRGEDHHECDCGYQNFFQGHHSLD